MNYDKKKYKLWDWKSPLIFQWKVNPGLAINELVLGQVIPKIMLIEREGNKPFNQRTFVPCPHCGTMHNGLKWSSKNKTAFKNWFGLYCDHCKEIIPVHRNFTSLLVMITTYPIWGWFKSSLKQNWLEKQPERYKKATLEILEEKNPTSGWLITGLYFGLFMFVAMVIVYPLLIGKKIDLQSLVVGIPLWMIMGLAWGYTMALWTNKKGKEMKAPFGNEG